MLKWIKRIFIVTLILIVSLICIALFYINKQNQSILKTKLEVNQDIQNKVASIAKKTKEVLDFYNQDHAMLSVGATFGIIQKIFYMGHYISVNPVLVYDVVYVFEQDEPYKFIDN